MPRPRKTLMRSLGECIGHIVRGVRWQPGNASEGTRRDEVRRTEQVERRGNVTLRRTVIEEIEYPNDPDSR